jgi:hypothetical protein
VQKASSEYEALAKMNMQDITFEAVVLRHKSYFSADAVRRSAERLKDWEQTPSSTNQ